MGACSLTRLAIASAAAIALAFPPGASAVSLYASSAPAVIRGAPPWTATYSLELDAGLVDETVIVGAAGTLVSVTGPAKVVSDGIVIADYFPAPGCSPVLPWTTATVLHGLRLELPAGTASVVTMSNTRSAFPAMTDNLSYEFRVSTIQPDETTADAIKVSLPGPSIMLPRRPRLTLRSPDVPRYGALVEHPPVRIRGATDRRLAGQNVELLYTSLETPDDHWFAKPHLIARVRVRSDGSFRYRWTPPESGRYSVGARYRSQDRRFVSTVSECRLGVGYATPG
jgi:hypothetical protein